MDKAGLKFFIAHIIYGTISLFLYYVNAKSEFVVLCRGILGSLFIVLMMLINKDLPNFKTIKSNLKYLIISGLFLGLNWIALFAGYRYGSAVTSLCNYTATIIIVVVGSIIYKEKLTIIQWCYVLMAFLGIVLVSGVLESTSAVDYHCVLFGMLAAVGFTILVFLNRKIKGVKPLDKTVVQLLASLLVVLPYVLLNQSIPSSLDTRSLIIIIIMGFVHTGLAYILYFNSIDTLPLHKIAIIGYVEPVLAVLIGIFVFKEPVTMLGAIGALLIIGATLLSEFVPK